MRTVYVPHLIRSASQAAEFPPGTRAVLWHVPWIAELIDPDSEEDAWQSKNGSYRHAEMIGTTALIETDLDELLGNA